MNNPIKILIAEDEPLNIKYLFEALSAHNYVIYTAPNGEIATEMASKYLPDAIIMDWDMPVMNGLEAIIHIRKQSKCKCIPIIMATGKMTTTENLRIALDAGANDYIRKPYDVVEIIARVKSMIRLNEEYRKNNELQEKINLQKIIILNHKLQLNKSALIGAKLQLFENAESFTKYIESLHALRKHVDEEGNKMITAIISHSKANAKRVNWNEFEQLFEKVHPEFYEIIQERFPSLSIHERKLCAMIKLNLNTQEISSVTGQIPETVKKAKYRLKSKFELGISDSVYQFIQNIK